MAQFWSKRTEQVTKAPGLYAFGSVFWAWFAGLKLSDLLYGVRTHKAADPVDYFLCPALLLVALTWSYLLVRTIRQLKEGHPISPSSQTE